MTKIGLGQIQVCTAKSFDKLIIWNWNRIGVINPLSIAANSQVGKRVNKKSVQIQVNQIL